MHEEGLKSDISPLELKWHSMGAAEAPPAHRRNPAAVTKQLTKESSIFIWSDQLVVPPLPLFPHLYILRVYDSGVEVWSTPSCGRQPLAVKGISGAIRQE